MEKVTITKNAFDTLWESQYKLWALEGAGVDNWCGYDDAMQSMEDEEED